MDWNKRFMFRLGKKQSETLIEFKCPVKGYRKKKSGKLFLLLFLLVSDCLVRNDLDQGWRLWIGLFLKSWDRHWYFIALFHPAFVPSWHWRFRGSMESFEKPTHSTTWTPQGCCSRPCTALSPSGEHLRCFFHHRCCFCSPFVHPLSCVIFDISSVNEGMSSEEWREKNPENFGFSRF